MRRRSWIQKILGTFQKVLSHHPATWRWEYPLILTNLEGQCRTPAQNPVLRKHTTMTTVIFTATSLTLRETRWTKEYQKSHRMKTWDTLIEGWRRLGRQLHPSINVISMINRPDGVKAIQGHSISQPLKPWRQILLPQPYHLEGDPVEAHVLQTFPMKSVWKVIVRLSAPVSVHLFPLRLYANILIQTAPMHQSRLTPLKRKQNHHRHCRQKIWHILNPERNL